MQNVFLWTELLNGNCTMWETTGFSSYSVEEIANSVQMLNGPQNGTKNGCNFPP